MPGVQRLKKNIAGLHYIIHNRHKSIGGGPGQDSFFNSIYYLLRLNRLQHFV